jgi:hypothetical protein
LDVQPHDASSRVHSAFPSRTAASARPLGVNRFSLRHAFSRTLP